MHRLQTYIEKVENEIKELVGEEISRDETDFANEEMLHLLFENCKHAKEFLACMEAKSTVI